MADFLLSEELSTWRLRVREFIDTRVIPAENAVLSEDREGSRNTLKSLQNEAKNAGLWVPHLPKAHGGLELGPMGMCALFREMGRSPIGAKVFNCDAPDQGNMDLLLAAASPAIKNKYVQPLIDGAITSAFCMTEPAPGAGADPTNLKTRAVKNGATWSITGHKWYSTGARNASFLIVMARTSDDPRTGATLFIVDRHAKGVTYVRDVPTMGDQTLDHIEGELKFDSVEVDDAAVLGGVGEGFRMAQLRLVPARLTHCMRWLGLADRTLELCRSYVSERVSFGKELARHQLIQKMISTAVTDLHAGNLMTLHAAWLLEQGKPKEAKPYASMAKNHVARALCQLLDDAIQMHGGLGYSDDLPFARWYRAVRAARIADGPDEVHDVTIARDWLLQKFEVLV